MAPPRGASGSATRKWAVQSCRARPRVGQGAGDASRRRAVPPPRSGTGSNVAISPRSRPCAEGPAASRNPCRVRRKSPPDVPGERPHRRCARVRRSPPPFQGMRYPMVTPARAWTDTHRPPVRAGEVAMVVREQNQWPPAFRNGGHRHVLDQAAIQGGTSVATSDRENERRGGRLEDCMNELFRRRAIAGSRHAGTESQLFHPTRAQTPCQALLDLVDGGCGQGPDPRPQQSRRVRDDNSQVRSLPQSLESAQRYGVKEGVARNHRMGEHPSPSKQVAELQVAPAARRQLEKPGKEARPAPGEQDRGQCCAPTHRRDRGGARKGALHRLPEPRLPEAPRAPAGEHDGIRCLPDRSEMCPRRPPHGGQILRVGEGVLQVRTWGIPVGVHCLPIPGEQEKRRRIVLDWQVVHERSGMAQKSAASSASALSTSGPSSVISTGCSSLTPSGPSSAPT